MGFSENASGGESPVFDLDERIGLFSPTDVGVPKGRQIWMLQPPENKGPRSTFCAVPKCVGNETSYHAAFIDSSEA
jgi:hypothetical protein